MTREEKQLKKFQKLIKENKIANKAKNDALKEIKLQKELLNQQFLKSLLNKNFPKLSSDISVKVINNYSKIVFTSKDENGSVLDFLSILFTKDLKLSSFENTFIGYKLLIPSITASKKLSLNNLIFIGKVSNFILKNSSNFIQQANKLIVKLIKKYNKQNTKLNKLKQNYFKCNNKVADFLIYEIFYRAKNGGGIIFKSNINRPIPLGRSEISNPIKLIVEEFNENYFKVKVIDKNKSVYFYEENTHISFYLQQFIGFLDYIENWPYQIK